MPAKINAINHISLHTWSRSHWDLPKLWRTGNYYEANMLSSPTFKVFQKHTTFSHKTFATTIAETAPPNCPRPLRVSLKFIKLESTFYILLFHSLVSHQQLLVITSR